LLILPGRPCWIRRISKKNTANSRHKSTNFRQSLAFCKALYYFKVEQSLLISHKAQLLPASFLGGIARAQQTLEYWNEEKGR